MFKDKKKHNHEADGNQKSESSDNVKTHNKDLKCNNRTRHRSGELLTVSPSTSTSYAQVIDVAENNPIIINVTAYICICVFLFRREKNRGKN